MTAVAAQGSAAVRELVGTAAPGEDHYEVTIMVTSKLL